jgi:CRISPR-associated endoribonuclease Cas6
VLPLLKTTRVLRLTRPGSLQPWMGPALRGLVARPFKEAVCLHTIEEQQGPWRYCRGCSHMPGCAYGQTLEPDPPAGAEVFTGQEQAVRPVVLSLPFPMPPRVRPGDAFPLTVTLIGTSAIGHAQTLWAAIREAGADPRRGFDPLHTTFELIGAEETDGPRPIELPLSVEGSQPEVPRVRVTLTAPLFLREHEGNSRRHNDCPTFGDLLRASLRTLGQLFRTFDVSHAADFAGLKQAAMRVPLIEADYVSFYQPHLSNRSGRRALHGVMGGAVYGPVPVDLVPWLAWGGRVHVGNDRVAGAGNWTVEPEPTTS